MFRMKPIQRVIYSYRYCIATIKALINLIYHIVKIRLDLLWLYKHGDNITLRDIFTKSIRKIEEDWDNEPL